jgi:putative ABC transport system substrate-binding protein
MPVVGFLRSSSRADATNLVAAFRRGLEEAGFIEGQNVEVDYRFADNQIERVPELAAGLIRRPVAVLFGDSITANAAKAATTTIPIVFAIGADPVRQGLVASLNRPGGNVTGVNFFTGSLAAKRLELLRQLAPNAKTFGVLMSPNSPESTAERKDVQAAGGAFGMELIILDVKSVGDIEAAFATLAERRVGALLVGPGSFMNSNRDRLVALAARHTLPATYPLREFALAGGLMSYGTSITDGYRQAGLYVGRVLKGEKPADLPVMQASKFEFVLNLKTAKALGLDVPLALQVGADEVIE